MFITGSFGSLLLSDQFYNQITPNIVRLQLYLLLHYFYMQITNTCNSNRSESNQTINKQLLLHIYQPNIDNT